MAINPKNPPNEITIVNAATPSYIVANGAAVSALNPLPTSSGGAATFPVVTLYQVTATFVDTNGTCNIGNILQNIVVYNATGTIIISVWNNLTQGFTLANPPPAGDIAVYVAGGAATSANQTTQIGLATSGNADLLAINNKLPAFLGQTLSAGSLSVVLASDEALPLPTGAATSALQTAGNASLTTIATETTAISGQLPATLGAKVTASSLAVNIASDQVVPVSATALPLPTGAATSANQATEIASLATIATQTTNIDNKLPPALGLQTQSNSLSVVVANQTSGDISATSLYTANTAFTGASIGDVIQEIAVYSPGTPNTFISATWNNLTTGLALASAPLAANLTPVTGGNTGTTSAVTTAEYAVNTAFAGGAIGDTIQQVNVINPSTQAVLSTTWNNLTQGTVLGSPPVLTNLTASASQLPPKLGSGVGAGESLSVYVVNPSTGSTSVVNTYTVTTGWTDGSQAIGVGDTLQQILIFNSSGVLTDTIWYDVTLAYTLVSPPPSNTFITQVTSTTATAGNQTTQITAANLTNTTLSTISSQIPTTLGQKVKASSLSVAIASDNTVATSSTQLPSALGQTTMAASLPVTLASNQSALGVTAAQLPASLGQTTSAGSVSTVLASDATLPLPTGAATSALQTTGNTSLSTIATNSTAITGQLPPALGLQTQSNSLSVVVSNPTSGDTATSSLYQVTTAFSGAALGDILQAIAFYAPGSPSTLVSTTWLNLTLGTTLGSAPTYTNITPITGGGGGGGSGTPAIAALYTAKTTDVPNGYNAGDSLQSISIVNSTTGAITATTWYNLTQGTTLTGAPTLNEVTAYAAQLPPSLGLQSAANSLSTVIANSATLTPALITTSTSGSTSAGAVTISFANTGAGAATIGSATLPAGGTLDFAAPVGRTINSITYNATGTTLLIATLS